MHACGCVLAYADKLLCMIIHLFTTSIIVAIMLHTNTAPASPDPMSYNLKYTDIPLRQYTLLSQPYSSSKSMGTSVTIAVHPEGMVVKHVGVFLYLLNLILFLHDSRDCAETAVSLLHQKRLGSGSEPTKEKIKLLK